MSENETQQPTPETSSVISESKTTISNSSASKSSLKFYLLSFLAVALVALVVVYQLEKEGRSGTSFFSSFIEKQESNKVVAVINGEEIINKDLETSINQFGQMAAAQGLDITTEENRAGIRQQSLDVLINTELLKQSARNRGISVSAEEVENRIEEIRIELGGEEILSGRMAELGIDMTKLRSDIMDEILIQTLLEEIFAEEDIQISDEEVLAVYEEAGGAEAGLPEIEQVRAQIIAQLKSSKEQGIVDSYLMQLRADADINIIE